MFKKFGILISTFVGLLTAFSFGAVTTAQSADLKVQFGKPNLQNQPVIFSENSQKEFLQIEDTTSLTDEPAISSENSQKLLEAQTPPPRRQAPIEPCPACGMG